VVTTVSSSSSNVPRLQHTCLHTCYQLPSLFQTTSGLCVADTVRSVYIEICISIDTAVQKVKLQQYDRNSSSSE
jgi:hypothetical protein